MATPVEHFKHIAVPRSTTTDEVDSITRRMGIALKTILGHQPKELPQEQNAIIDRFQGLGRGDRYEFYMLGEMGLLSLAELLARRVTSRHNKNVILTLFGDPGSGKSMALLALAVAAAQWIALRRGGKPEDYFNFTHVAVIDPTMLKETLNNLKPYAIYILDDAGPGFDAREFMSKTNRELSHILQTCRTFHNILLISAPHGSMIDITSHRLAQYFSEVSEVHHDEGLTFLKVFKVIRAYRDKNKIFYPYMTSGNMVIKRFCTTLPPLELKKEYDAVREAKAAEIQKRNDATGSGGSCPATKPEEDVPPQRKKTPKERRIDMIIEAFPGEVRAMYADTTRALSDIEIAENLNRKMTPEKLEEFGSIRDADLRAVRPRLGIIKVRGKPEGISQEPSQEPAETPL